MTAEEYLMSKIGCFSLSHPFCEKVYYEDIVDWLQDYAKQEAIEFAEWIDKHKWFFHIEEWICLGKEESYTTEQLWYLYKKEEGEKK